MQAETRNPALIGAGLAKTDSVAGTVSEHITTALVLKTILKRVAVSESVALIMAKHAGLIREVR